MAGVSTAAALSSGAGAAGSSTVGGVTSVVEMVEAAGGSRQVADAEGLRGAVAALLADPGAGAAMAAKGREVLAQHEGATARTAAILLGESG